MNDEINKHGRPEGLPALLGGNPVRPARNLRTTPEHGEREKTIIDAWLAGAPNWEPDAPKGGWELGAYMQLDPREREGLRLDGVIADALGWEPAAAMAEFHAIHAPGQDVTFVPFNNGTRVITGTFAGIAQWADELGVRRPVVGSEVIVPAATWQATAGALLSRNLAPVLVDVDPDTLCISPDAVENAITDKTVAIVVVHLYQRLADMKAILEIARKHDLAVIEDCAHAHGARFGDGRAAGTVGHAGTFSLQGSKTLSCGEGGAFVSTHRELALQVASIATCGRQLQGTKVMQADNDRLPAVAAALLRAQIRRFPLQNALRAEGFARLDEFAATLPGVVLFPAQPDAKVLPTYKWLFRIDFASGAWGSLTQAQIAKALEAELNCEFATMYEPLNRSPLYTPHSDPANRISEEYWERIEPRQFSAPNAERAFGEVLAVEHAAGLDPYFAPRFQAAVLRIQHHAEALAAELAGLA